MSESVRVVVADKHSLLRAGLVELLGSMPAREDAAPAALTVEMARDWQLDVLVVDIDLPGPGPIAILQELAETGPATRVVVLTSLGRDRPSPRLLSSRELEILSLVAAARSNREIARKLFISEATVKRHLANVYAKLRVSSRMAAVRVATAEGLLAGPAGAASELSAATATQGE